jgi:hypothetical protein
MGKFIEVLGEGLVLFLEFSNAVHKGFDGLGIHLVLDVVVIGIEVVIVTLLLYVNPRVIML